MDTSVTRVIFCKGGKEISILPKDGNKFIFESAQPVSPESPGEYFCRYQHKEDRNQEKNSLPSARRHVSAPVPSCCDSFPGLGLIVGLAVTASLALGLLGCFLMKTVVSRCRTHRDPSPDRSSLAAEDQIQYAEVTRVGTAQHWDSQCPTSLREPHTRCQPERSPGKETVMEPVNQPASSSVWVKQHLPGHRRVVTPKSLLEKLPSRERI
ncbi:unnamed protein product [Caretta caretta]